MKAIELSQILLKTPYAEVTISVSDGKTTQLFADRIIEVTSQGEKQITIVADIRANCNEPDETDDEGCDCGDWKYSENAKRRWCGKCGKEDIGF
jgi:hypothetical protein